MKLLFLNKREKKLLIKLLTQEVLYNTNCPYELTTLLEKLSPGNYEYLFKIMK